MKLIDNIIVKYGMDKVLHFLGGLSITSIILMIFAMLDIHFAISTIFAFVITSILAIIKEWIDNTFCWQDVWATIMGSIIPIIIYNLLLIFI